MIIIELYEWKGLQLIANMVLSMTMLMYVAHVRPYSISIKNNSEIYNEVSGFIIQYFLMWLAIFPPIDVSQVSILTKIGWIYIASVASNLAVNFLYVGIQQAIKIPALLKNIISKYDIYKFEWWKKNFFNEKMSINSKNATRIEMAFQLEATKMQAKEEYLKELEILEEN